MLQIALSSIFLRTFSHPLIISFCHQLLERCVPTDIWRLDIFCVAARNYYHIGIVFFDLIFYRVYDMTRKWIPRKRPATEWKLSKDLSAQVKVRPSFIHALPEDAMTHLLRNSSFNFFTSLFPPPNTIIGFILLPSALAAKHTETFTLTLCLPWMLNFFSSGKNTLKATNQG